MYVEYLPTTPSIDFFTIDVNCGGQNLCYVHNALMGVFVRTPALVFLTRLCYNSETSQNAEITQIKVDEHYVN